MLLRGRAECLFLKRTFKNIHCTDNELKKEKMMQPYTERFECALIYAHQLHKDQPRKGTEVPYISHLLAVTSLVIEIDGDEDEVIAALLHDGPEDQGGEETLNDIREKFGDRVADIVAECSDTFEEHKPLWKERKEKYIQNLKNASKSALKVSCADKLHNARSILFDYKIVGEELWGRFKGGREGTLWYYKTLVDTYKETSAPSNLVRELSSVVDELMSLTSK